MILEHLTPFQQALFSSAKDFKQQYDFKFCWVKNQSILLREDEESDVIRVKCLQDLIHLRDDFLATTELPIQSSWPSLPSGNSPAPVFGLNQLRGAPSNMRGRGQRGHRGSSRNTRSITIRWLELERALADADRAVGLHHDCCSIRTSNHRITPSSKKRGNSDQIPNTSRRRQILGCCEFAVSCHHQGHRP